MKSQKSGRVFAKDSSIFLNLKFLELDLDCIEASFYAMQHDPLLSAYNPLQLQNLVLIIYCIMNSFTILPKTSSPFEESQQEVCW